MRYVSPDTRLIGPEAAFEDTAGRQWMLWERMRESMGAGRFWSMLLVLLLTLTVARSTSTVNWVDGIDVITPIALAGALLMGVLALTPLRSEERRVGKECTSRWGREAGAEIRRVSGGTG